MNEKKVFLVTLGCPKNLVDSESMRSLLEEQGYRFVSDQSLADYVLVNTCGFIEPARKESLSVLQDVDAARTNGQFIIAAGCMVERHSERITQAVPGVDALLGTHRWMDVLTLLENLEGMEETQVAYLPTELPLMGSQEACVLRSAVQGGSAYLMIADGCRRSCAYCSIPLIKGTAVSRPMENIITDAEALQDQGIHEITLVAQDTTDYGVDLRIQDGLAQLLEQMLPRIPDVDWIRIMYAFPGRVSDRLIEVMAQQKQVLPYLDLPLQHAHPEVLRRMHRPANMTQVKQTIERCRQAMPDLALRSTFIVGYPGETEEEFAELIDFVAELRFDHVGVFPYSYEPGTASAKLADNVPEDLKNARRDELMALQQQIALENNQSRIGSRIDVLIEGSGDGMSVGRTYRDAPEVDGMVLIEQQVQVGQIVPVLIKSALPYDLIGTIE